MDMFEAPKRAAQSPFWALFTLTLALIIWFSFQLSQIMIERESQLAAYNMQEPDVQTASKLRNSLDALATGAYRLAAKGNVNAKQLIDSLGKRGILIHPPKD
jgi:hypothetical protein